MGRKKRSLSMEDRKAVDVILNSAADRRITPLAEPASPKRIGAVTKLLSLLNQLPASDPPADLLAKTMARIDQQTGRKPVQPPHAAIISAAQLH